MTSAEDYSQLAEAAYEADPLWKSPPLKNGASIPPGADPKFRVVSDPVSDPVTGFQAVAVAPMVNGQPDYSQVHFTYAGTNPAHSADIRTDVQEILGGRAASATQAEQALAYTKRVIRDLLKTHPEAGFDTVGHSLGGYLAMYVAGELHLSATAFNGPDAWAALSPQAREWLLAQIAAGRKPFTNYVNEWDLVGNFRGNESGAAVYVTGERGHGFPADHNIPTAFDFNDDGSMKGAGAKRRSIGEITDNLLSGLPEGVHPYVSPLLAGVATLLQNPAVGAVAGMALSGVMVTMDTLATASMAANILQLEAPLQAIKTANSALVPQMEKGLAEAQNAMMMIPSITLADISNCVVLHRLNVRENIDAEAVAAVNTRVDEHITLVHQLVAGIGLAAQNALAQDAQWAHIYSGS